MKSRQEEKEIAKKLSKLQMAQQKAEAAAKKTNQKINELGRYTSALYTSLTTMQSLFDRIRNMPEEMLLVNLILGLQPKYSEQDFDRLCAAESDLYKRYFKEHKIMVISMANLLYKVKLDDKDKKLLAKSLKKNKEFLALVQMTKKEFDADDISMIERALNHRYKYSTY